MIEKDIIVLVRILKRVTFVVKLTPFVTALILLFAMASYLFGNETVSTILDRMCYVSPLIVAVFLMLSHSLKLCKWHKLETILQLLPLGVGIIDDFVLPLSSVATQINLIITLSILIISFINTYFVFFRHGEKCNQIKNPRSS
jgi:hypothetical protein